VVDGFHLKLNVRFGPIADPSTLGPFGYLERVVDLDPE
jgi:hypothetical protein